MANESLPAFSADHNKASVYQIVTETILKQLESGIVPWRRPWNTAAPCNLVSQKEYQRH